MADIANLTGLFTDDVLVRKAALLDRLEAVGYAHPAFHCNGHTVWVCPDYVSEEGAERLATALERAHMKQQQLSLDDIRVFTGFQYG